MIRDKIKQIAIKMVTDEGLINLSRSGLCRQADIPVGSFRKIMGCSFLDFVKEIGKTDSYSPFMPTKKPRTYPDLRKDYIVKAAVSVAIKLGFEHLTRNGIAAEAGVAHSLVSHYFTMEDLRNEVMEEAVEREILRVIAYGIATRHPAAADLSPELFSKVMRSLTSK